MRAGFLVALIMAGSLAIGPVVSAARTGAPSSPAGPSRGGEASSRGARKRHKRISPASRKRVVRVDPDSTRAVVSAAGSKAADSSAARAAARPQAAVTDSGLPTGRPRELVAVGLAEVRRMLDQKAAIFLDARGTDRFAAGHIPGALSCSADSFAIVFPALEPLLPKDARIVLYCEGKDCPMASELGYQLLPLGYSNLFYYKNGWEEWDAARAPREAGASSH